VGADSSSGEAASILCLVLPPGLWEVAGTVDAVKYGFVLPYGDARVAADLATIAEDHGWDAFFVWEGIWAIDAWVALTAAAMQTERILLGTMSRRFRGGGRGSWQARRLRWTTFQVAE
jgi:hypothetical protein